MKLVGVIGPVLALLVPYLFFEMFRNSRYDVFYVAPHGHFYIVSLVAILSTVIGIAVGVAGSRLRNIKVSFLSLAFISLAGVFAVHGLSTPGFILHTTQLPAIASQVSVLLASVWLWLSSLSSDHFLITKLSRWKNSLVPVWTSILIIFCTFVMIFPQSLELFPINRNPLKFIVSATIILLNIYSIYTYFQSYRYSKFPLQIAIVYSAAWFIVSELIMVLGELWRLSWWLYHFLLLASMLAMLIGFLKQYGANRSLSKTIQALYTTDPVERMTNFLSPSVKALIAATESKDVYTAGHNFRVTMYALRIAEELELQPEQCRAIVMGSIIHDVGKINIPDSILNKPGRLTEEERIIIQSHPVVGYKMCKNLGFMKEELSIIRSHHEKWDGTGYPDGLAGRDIPLLARIAAVADVYDAVTSNRSYRKAWSHEETIAFLESQKGLHFDPECVDAWARVCEREPQVYKNAQQGTLIKEHIETVPQEKELVKLGN